MMYFGVIILMVYDVYGRGYSSTTPVMNSKPKVPCTGRVVYPDYCPHDPHKI